MKKKRTIILLTLLLLLIMPVTLLAWVLAPEQYGDTFLGELKYKVQLLQETEGKRIILVGGSSVAFGIDSQLLQEHFPDYRVVNFGMYAALGTTVMLELSQPYIHPGDIVILMPEQQEQTLSDYFDAAVMWQGVDGAPELLSLLSRDHLGQMLGALPGFAGEKFACILRNQRPQPEGVYVRNSFNDYGDVDSALCLRNIMPGTMDPYTPIRFDPEMIAPEFLEQINGYAAALEQQGATLWYGFCPMNASAVEEDADIDAFYDALQDQLRFPILGDPHDSVLEAGWFYDTNFHLNSSGKLLFTKHLIRSIKAALADSSPTLVSVPPMPEPEAAVLWHGDDSDLDCFLLGDLDGVLTVTGLSELGTASRELTVPSTWEGRPITAIAPGAFQDCDSLVSISIQENIRRIGDHAFYGCTGLVQIRMLSRSPSQCTVGQALLTGTEADVLVPVEALSSYRTDYFWSIHAGRILPDNVS